MIASLIGLGASAVGSLLGAVGSARKGRQAQEALDNSHRQAQNWYDTQLASDYTQRGDVQAVLTKQRELLRDQYKRARATNAVAGGTDESLANMQNSANQSLANTMSSVASSASSYKDSINNAKLAENQQYAQQSAEIKNAQAQAMAQAGAGVAQAAGGLIASDKGPSIEDWLKGLKAKKNAGQG